jgi:5,5'-dehydrodivanillate O-demethylase oxygenase subunit
MEPKAMIATDHLDLVHTGPETLAGRFMRTFWQPVYRSTDLKPGEAVPIRIMAEAFTLYRGEVPSSETHGQVLSSELRVPSQGAELERRNAQLGTPHVLPFRCAHRGTQLSTGWVEGDTLRCFYHGWRYDGSGQCVEQPGEDESFTQKVRLRSYPTQEYLGLIFVYFGEGEPPALPHYPEFDAPGVLDVYPPEVWPCNFFNRIDNACDAAHLTFAHRESRVAIGTLRELPEVRADETEYGVLTSMAVPGKKASTLHFHMPNINQFFQGDTKLRDPMNASTPATMARLLFRVPVDDESCISFPIDHVSLTGDAGAAYLERRRRLEEAQRAAPASPEDMGEAVLRSRLRVPEVRERDPANLKTLTSVEDYVAQVGQGAIVNQATDRLGRMDAGVILVRQLWQRELRKLAQGEPLKQWRRTTPLDGEER